MTLLNPFCRWTSSLLAHLELGRKRRIRRQRQSGLACEVERLEKKSLLSGVVVQIDSTPVLNADVVVNKPANAAVDATQSSVDKNSGGGNWDFVTQTAASALKSSGATANGLPDNGFIAANAFHPEVQLSANNANNGNNARRAGVDGVILPVSQFAFTLNVPQNKYSDVHVFLTAANGSATFNLKLNYTDGTSKTSTAVVVPDWSSPVTDSSSTYNLITGLDREKANLSSYQDANVATIFGFRFAADSSRTLQSLTVTPVSVQGSIVFFGAVGVMGNHPPVLSAIPNQTISEQSALIVNTSASDPDGNAVTFSLDAAPTGAAINPATGQFSWTPTEAQDGIYTVSVRVTDNGSPALSDVKSFQVTVNEVNQAPVLAVYNPPAVVKTTALNFQVASATDGDLVGGIPNKLTFSLAQTGGPASASGASIDPKTGVLAWTPSADQAAGNYTFNVAVNDNTGAPNAVVSKPITVTLRSVGIVNGNLLVVGTSSNDNISIAPGSGSQINVAVNAENYVVDGSAITGQIKVLGFQGTDTVQVNGGIGHPYEIDESGVSNKLIVTATGTDDNIVLADNTISVDGNLITYYGEASLVVDALGGGDTVAMSGHAGAFSTTIDGGTGFNIFSASLAGEFDAVLQLLDIESANINVGGNFGGKLTSVEDPAAPGSGVINSLTVHGSITTGGFVGAGAIAQVVITGDMNGTIIAAGAGTITGMNIGGSLTGSVTAVEDANAGSGTISGTTVGSVGSTGSMTGGALSGVTVTNDMAGTIKAQGAGTITGMNIGGSLTGSMTAVEDANAGSGTISGTTVGSVGSTGSMTGGALSGVTVTNDMAGTIKAQGAGTITGMNIGGSLTGSVTAVEDANAGSGTISGTTVGSVGSTGSMTGGALSGVTVTNDMAGTIKAQGAGTITGMNIGGSLTGSMTAVEDANAGSGTISGTTVGSVGSTGSMTGGALSGVTVTNDMAGTIKAQGAGTITGMNIGGSLTGSMTAVEDANAGSGTISGTTVGSVGSTGTMTGGALSGVTVTNDMAGTIKAQGAGTITGMNIGGSLTGSMTAVEDANAGSGTISGTTVGSVGSTGSMTGGALSGVTVTNDMAGTIKAQGAGTITGMNIGGSLTGSVTAVEDANAGSGTISGTTVGSVGSTGSMTGGALSGVTVTNDMAGTIKAQGAGTITGMNIGGSLTGSVTAVEDANAGSGTISGTTVGSVGSTGTMTGGALSGVTVTNDMAGTIKAQGAGTITGMNIGGSLTGSMTAVEDANAGSGTISGTTVGSVGSTGTMTGGALSGVTVTNDMAGTIKAQGAGTITGMNIGGSLTGSMTAVEDANAGSGTISGTTVGSVGSTGSMTGGALSGVTVTNDMAGTIKAQGAGTITGMNIGGSLTGSMTAVEDANAGSGTISGTTVGSVGSTGTMTGGALSGVTVTNDMAGTIKAQGAGTITGMNIGGSLTGSMTAVEDANAGSGTISGTTVGSVGSTGSMTGGALSGVTVTNDMAGTIKAQGAGTITGMNIGGSLTGSMTAVEDANAGSGTISGTTVGRVGSTGSMTGGTLTGVSVTTDMAGTITAQGAGTMTGINILGNISGKIEAKVDAHSGSGKIGTLAVGGITGKVQSRDIDVLTVAGVVVGSVSASGTIGQATISTVAAGGSVSSNSVNTLNVSTDAGQVNVTNAIGNATIGTIAATGALSAGTLTSVTVTGAISGNLAAANVGTMQGTNVSADGTTVVKITQAGVERRIVAIPVSSLAAMPAGVKFTYFYDGTSGSNPQAAVRVTNGTLGTSADDVPFDLELITNSAKEFDLARVDANGTSGIRNVVIQGNILSAITAATANYMGLSANAAGGVQLPLDNMNGVFAADNVQAGNVLANSIQAVAFGSVTAGNTRTMAASATVSTANSVLANGTRLIQGASAYVVPFSENQPVAFFYISAGDQGSSGNQGSFTEAPVLFTDQLADNKSNMAAITIAATPGQNSRIQTIGLTGDGGAIQTSQWIQSEITSSARLGDVTSSGSLGDVIISASQGITANVSAPIIIGNIDATRGSITGNIEATAGDLGRALTDSNGMITGVTFIHSGGSTMSGMIISRGNLISSVLDDGSMSGVIAAQGDIGAIQRDSMGQAVVGSDIAHSLTRFGGIRVNGGTSGQIVALGNVFGDMLLNGGLDGRIAVKGQQVAGLAPQRYGILGNVTVSGQIGSAAAIVSAGVIGDDGVYVEILDSDVNGTHLNSGTDNGILAAEGDINFGKTGKLNASGLFENALGANKTAIDAIFTQDNKALKFDDTFSNHKTGLDLILGDLAALRVDSDGNLTGTTA